MLTEKENLVPERSAEANVEAVAKQRDHPLEQKHPACGFVIFKVLVYQRRIGFTQLPKHLIGFEDLNLVGDVEIKEHAEPREYQITKGNEALLWSVEVDQQHRGQVAHPLHVADIRPVVLKRAQHLDQAVAEAMDLLK